MADVRPFSGIRYDAAKAGDLDLVVSPPYDVIGPELQEKLYSQSPYGIVRIDYGKVQDGDSESENRYTRSDAIFNSWQDEGVLVRDAQPCFYYVEEDYVGEFGRERTRCGFLAAVRVETAESGVYRPHEKTLAGPKADRLNLTRACRANLSPVFSLYDDPDCGIDEAFAAWKKSAGEPDVAVTGTDGVPVRMWLVDDEAVAATVASVMEPKSFFIADGHHRYETALNYRKEMLAANPGATGDEPWNFVLMYLVNMHSPGLSVLPTHRAVFGLEGFDAAALKSGLSERFDLTEVDGGIEAVLPQLEKVREERPVFSVLTKGGPALLVSPKADLDLDAILPEKTPALRKLDVTLIHSLVIEAILGIDQAAQELQLNLRYVKDARELAEQVESGSADVGIVMNPTPVTMVKEAAEAGERMPQKSTYFYPKLVTGLVINPLF